MVGIDCADEDDKREDLFQQLSFQSSQQEFQPPVELVPVQLMQPSQEHDSDIPTKEEVFRDFFIFWMNHRNEKLFRHDAFSSIVSSTYSDSSIMDKSVYYDNTGNNEALNRLRRMVLAQPINLFLDLLRRCRDISSNENLLGKLAMSDLRDVIDYAKEACSE